MKKKPFFPALRIYWILTHFSEKRHVRAHVIPVVAARYEVPIVFSRSRCVPRS